jgi:hypothetical protein
MAGLSHNTAAKARNELSSQDTITYQAGAGRGTKSTYRLLKVPNNAGHLYDSERYPNGAAKGTQTGPRKGNPKNAVASGNENTVLKASVLGTSDLETSAIRPPNQRAKNEDPTAVSDLVSRLRYEMGWK